MSEHLLNAPAADKSGRNFGLDVIRAVAIGLVVLAHYATVAPVSGVLGVELFFVLSGFLIGGILYRTVQSQERFSLADLRRFWVRRWMRTLPNYYLFLGLFAALAAATFGAGSLGVLWQYPLFLQNFCKPPPILYEISWSLAVEEWFYLLFPLLFAIAYNLSGQRPANRRTVFLSCAAFLAILSIALRLWTGTSVGWSSGMRMVVVYRFDALMCGVVLAVVKSESARGWKWLQAAYPLGAVVLAAGTVIAHRAFPSAAPVIPAAWLLMIIPLGCALILPRATRLGFPNRFGTAVITYVSQCSYSMYLCHLPILFFFMRMAHDNQQGMLGKLVTRTAALLVTLTCAGLLYRYVEKSILALAPKDRFSPTKPSLRSAT